jgi:hypothetical protein
VHTNLCEPMCCQRNLLLDPLDGCQQTDFFAFETGFLHAKRVCTRGFLDHLDFANPTSCTFALGTLSGTWQHPKGEAHIMGQRRAVSDCKHRAAPIAPPHRLPGGFYSAHHAIGHIVHGGG